MYTVSHTNLKSTSNTDSQMGHLIGKIIVNLLHFHHCKVLRNKYHEDHTNDCGSIVIRRCILYNLSLMEIMQVKKKKKYHTNGWFVILVHCLYNKVENISDDSQI
jgi:hypothetical protein